MGCKVEFKSIDVDTSYEAFLTGDITLALAAHETVFPNPVKTALITGDIIDAGNHEAIYRDDWWYPTQVEDLCPGLPDWNALNRCSKIFSRSNSEEKGVYFDGPNEWQQNNNQIT
jgi:glycine betaine/proline transport system substrate-binding protein